MISRRHTLAGLVSLASPLGRAAEAPEPQPVVEGLDSPWALAFLPNGGMLVTEKRGRLLRIGHKGLARKTLLTGVPPVKAAGQGGLLDVAVRTEGADTIVYLTYSEPGSGADEGLAGTAVTRARLVGDALRDLQVIFRQAHKAAGTGHFGSRLAFARDGMLFVTLGERQSAGERVKAQDLRTHHGKVIRIRPDGSVPPDNPFVGQAGARPEIWSYGHRNPQGAAIHPRTGELWISEHGPQGGDEINVARRGLNYGWPLVSYGCAYGEPVGRCTPYGGASQGPGLEQPVTWWVPTSIAPSGLAFYDGAAVPEWQGNLFVGALAGQALWRLVLDGDKVVSREALYTSMRERVRDVRQGPDGALYMVTESSGTIWRIAR